MIKESAIIDVLNKFEVDRSINEYSKFANIGYPMDSFVRSVSFSVDMYRENDKYDKLIGLINGINIDSKIPEKYRNDHHFISSFVRSNLIEVGCKMALETGVVK